VGPIRVGANGRAFIDHDGRPFFWLGDTQWELGRAFTLAEVGAILQNRADKGFTTIQVMLTGVGDGTRPNWAGDAPWQDNDPATPNEAYFRHVDAVLELAGRYGLVLVLGVYHQLQVDRIPFAKAQSYARWIARRYRDVPHIIWSMYPRAEAAYAPICRVLAEGLQEGDGGAHLITVHPDPSPASSSFLQGEALSASVSWLAFHSIQTWKYVELIYPMVRQDLALEPAKPVVMAEGAYEGGTEYGFEVTPLWARRQAYHSYLAGGHHTYGHNDNWRVPPAWREALDAPGAFHMGILRRILEARSEWWNAAPDQGVFAEEPKGGPRRMPHPLRNVAIRSAQQDWALAYLSSDTTVAVRLDRVAAGGTVDAAWIDPTTGQHTPIGRLASAGIRFFSAPAGWQDALLLLERR
jgi:hypothetical protein